MQIKVIRLETIIAMLCITILEAAALVRGLDGAIFAPVIVVIAGLGGFYMGQEKKMQTEIERDEYGQSDN